MAAPKHIKVGDKPVLLYDAKGVGGKETKLLIRALDPEVTLFFGVDDKVGIDSGWPVKDEKLEWQFPVEHQQLWAIKEGEETTLSVWAIGPGT